MTEDGKNEKDIARRISIARDVFNKMRQTLCRREISLPTRKRILKCYVWSTLLYGVETWTFTNSLLKRIKAFEMWTYRRMLRIAWTDKITNEEVSSRMGNTPELELLLKTKKLKYYGHVRRHDSLQKHLLEGRLEGIRPRGRPRTTWLDNIRQWTGLTLQQVLERSLKRDEWRVNTLNPALLDET